MSLTDLDATIEMHPHATGEREFICFCAKAHAWNERGTRTFIIPSDKYKGEGWQMIQCACGIWHMKPITRQSAENLINEEKA